MSSFGSSVINKSGKKLAPKAPPRRPNRPAARSAATPSLPTPPATQASDNAQSETGAEEPQAKRRRLDSDGEDVVMSERDETDHTTMPEQEKRNATPAERPTLNNQPPQPDPDPAQTVSQAQAGIYATEATQQPRQEPSAIQAASEDAPADATPIPILQPAVPSERPNSNEIPAAEGATVAGAALIGDVPIASDSSHVPSPSKTRRPVPRPRSGARKRAHGSTTQDESGPLAQSVDSVANNSAPDQHSKSYAAERTSAPTVEEAPTEFTQAQSGNEQGDAPVVAQSTHENEPADHSRALSETTQPTSRQQSDTNAAASENRSTDSDNASDNGMNAATAVAPAETAITLQQFSKKRQPRKAASKAAAGKAAAKPASEKPAPVKKVSKRKRPSQSEDSLNDDSTRQPVSPSGPRPAEPEQSRPARTSRARGRRSNLRAAQPASDGESNGVVQGRTDGGEDATPAASTSTADDHEDHEETSTTRSRKRHRLAGPTADGEDLEKHEINPAETQMTDLTRDSGKGRMGKIEKRMLEINWEEVARKRREAEEREFEEAERERAEQEINARLDRAGEQGPGNVSAPKTKIVNGEIVIDNSSLVLDRHAAAAADADGAVVEENEEDDYTKKVNHHSYLHDNRRDPEERRIMKMQAEPWTEEQTAEFFSALAMFGTDFYIISTMFPGKTRRQIKLKFIREERADMARINRILLGKENPQPMSIAKYAEMTGHEEAHYKRATDVAAELEASKQETMEELQRQREAQEAQKNDRARKAQEKIEATKQERAAKRAARKNKRKGPEAPDDGGEIIQLEA